MTVFKARHGEVAAEAHRAPARARVPLTIMAVLAGLYAAQSITGSMVQTALPVVLRDAGMSLENIGYLSLLFLPWALKFLWAPLVDRFGTRRNWILGCQVALAACFIAASMLPPATHLGALSMVLLLMATVAATQDVATDSFGVHASTPDTRATASGASTAGGYGGFLLGTGLWLAVYAAAGWAVSMLVMAACVGLLTIPTLFASIVVAEEPARNSGKRPGLRAALSNRRLVTGLLFLLVYQTGVRLAVSMTGPLLVDADLSIATIGWIRGTGGSVAGLLAAVFGAAIAHRLGLGKALALVAAFNMVICVALAAVMLMKTGSPTLLVTLLLLQSAGVAMSFVALYAAMMNWCAPQQVATDFAVLQSADAVLAIVAGIGGGMLGQYVGYPAIFILSAALLAGGILCIRRLPAPPETGVPQAASR